MDCSFFPPLLMSTLNMHEADIKALLCRCCESLSTEDKGRWLSRFIELQRRQNSMIQPELLHRGSSGFPHEPSSSAHPSKGTMDLPPPGVARSSGPRKEKRGKSLQFCAALQELHSAQLKFGSIQRVLEQPGPGSSVRTPEILQLPEAGLGLRG